MAPPPTVTPTAAQLPPDLLPGASTAPAKRDAAQAVRHAAAAASGLAASESPAAEEGIDTSAAINELVDALRTTSIGLRFELDEDTHRVITKVVDKETGELIRQMPTEEVLHVARAIDKLQGLFISHAV